MLAGVGIWGNDGPADATLWITDCEVGLLPGAGGLNNLVRRDGAPLELKDSQGNLYEEGRDFDPISNPAAQKQGY